MRSRACLRDGNCVDGCIGCGEVQLRRATPVLQRLQLGTDRKTARSLTGERSGRRRAASSTSSPAVGEEGGGTAMAAELDGIGPRLAAYGDNGVR
jgi:hypothetical protein